MGKICLIKVGNIVEGFLQVIFFGRSKDIAGWVALKLGYQDCKCEQRRIFLNELFGCKEGIKL